MSVTAALVWRTLLADWHRTTKEELADRAVGVATCTASNEATAAFDVGALPDDVLDEVFARLNQDQLSVAGCVCRRWRDTARVTWSRMLRGLQEGPSLVGSPAGASIVGPDPSSRYYAALMDGQALPGSSSMSMELFDFQQSLAFAAGAGSSSSPLEDHQPGVDAVAIGLGPSPLAVAPAPLLPSNFTPSAAACSRLRRLLVHQDGSSGHARVVRRALVLSRVATSRALRCAVLDDDPSLLEEYLARGYSPNYRNSAGQSVLEEALTFYSGRGDATVRRMIRTLIAAGANVNARTSDGCTMLQSVVMLRMELLAGMLLAAGADHSARGPHGTTALHASAGDATESNERMCQDLLRRGADPNAINDKQETPMHKVLQQRYSERRAAHVEALVGQLLRAGADPNLRCAKAKNALHLWASRHWRHPVVGAMLLRAGCSVCHKDRRGFTPLHYLAQRASGEVGAEAVASLLAAGADANARARGFGQTPLHLAVVGGSPPVLQALLDRGAALDTRDYTGASYVKTKQANYTPLHVAVAWGSSPLESVSALIKAGANVLAKDCMGYCAVDLARKRAKEAGRGGVGSGRGHDDASGPPADSKKKHEEVVKLLSKEMWKVRTRQSSCMVPFWPRRKQASSAASVERPINRAMAGDLQAIAEMERVLERADAIAIEEGALQD